VNTGVGLRAMRVESDQILGPWGSFVGMGMRTGERGGESSSLRQDLGTWEAWCGGGSRKACCSPGAVAGIGVRTCWRCFVVEMVRWWWWVIFKWGRFVDDSKGDRAQAGACSPLTVQTERVSSLAMVSGGGKRWMGSSGGRGRRYPGLSAAHLVLECVKY
jgi:hypothetical protein